MSIVAGSYEKFIWEFKLKNLKKSQTLTSNPALVLSLPPLFHPVCCCDWPRRGLRRHWWLRQDLWPNLVLRDRNHNWSFWHCHLPLISPQAPIGPQWLLHRHLRRWPLHPPHNHRLIIWNHCVVSLLVNLGQLNYLVVCHNRPIQPWHFFSTLLYQ